MENKKRMYRSNTQKMLGGVLGGIAEYFDVDPTIVRPIYVILSVFSACFPGIIVYIACMFIIPKDPGYTDI